MSKLKAHEILALKYLAKGPDTIKEVTEGNMAAVIVFEDLKRRGLVEVIKDMSGLSYFISDRGRAALGEDRK